MTEISISHQETDSRNELPPEQQEYYSYRDARKRLHDAATPDISLSEDAPSLPLTHEQQIARAEYVTRYGIEPERDGFFDREPASCEGLLDSLFEGHGQRWNLPVLVDGKPVVISAYHVPSGKEHEPEVMSYVKPGVTGDIRDYMEQARTYETPVHDIFFLDVGYHQPDGRLESLGKCDFIVIGNKKVGLGGGENTILQQSIDPTIDRHRVGNILYPFKVDTATLKADGKHGLGRMLFALSTHLCGRAGAEHRVVPSDATASQVGRDRSYYVSEMKARLEPLPEFGIEDPIPTLDTDDFTPGNRLNGFAGYWLPVT